ncbi:MAG: hypothetical protein GX046_07470 [Tissierellia bacterium]|nr:hypothetical protein [Tissierellia bacterium]
MKVFISADIEGITGVSSWDETELGHDDHIRAAQQMTREVSAAARAALDLGYEVLIKDAHDSARNILLDELPRGVNILRGWTSTPLSMMAGLDESFDAVIFIGYHAPGGKDGNPLAHSFSRSRVYSCSINGKIASELSFNRQIANHYKVPCVFLSGDEVICKEAQDVVPGIETLAVKKGEGNATFDIHPEDALELIYKGVTEGLKKKEELLQEEPQYYHVSFQFRDHAIAHRASFYPGVRKVSPYEVVFEGKDIMEVMTTKMFIV